MKKLCLLVWFWTIAIGLPAQTAELIVKSSSKGSYVEHKVIAKENFYSIGRLFNVHPRHLASFNSLDMTKGLSMGQIIKVPLTDTNFNHKSAVGTPVYYITGNGETVYNVSTNNKVLMERLRAWNQLPGDKLPAGMKLIVGYLVTNEAMALAVNSAQTTPAKDAQKAPAGDSRKTADSLARPAKSNASSTTMRKQDKKKDSSQVAKTPAIRNDAAAEKKNEKGKPDSLKAETSTTGSTEQEGARSLPQGYFKASFDQQVKQQPVSREQTLTAGIFKTSSGWSDSKYYMLMDGIEPGTIVRITNPGNNKIVYAKLLGELTDVKKDQGLNMRISNAAAAALDIAETDRFVVKINY